MKETFISEDKLHEINKRLYEVSERQVQNQRDLITNEQSEQHFQEISKKYSRLFDRLFCTWNKDKAFANWLDEANMEILHNKQKITYELDNNREALNQDKRRLNEMEQELYREKQAFLRKVK